MVRFLKAELNKSFIMKSSGLLFVFICSIILVNSSKIKAQYSEEEIVKKGYTTDGIINILIDYIPAGWKFTEENGYFIFQRKDSIWELTENTLNVPFEKKEDRSKRILANGKRTVSKIVIKYEDKWDFLKVQEASISNTSVYSEIRLLPEKYQITNLKDPAMSVKGNLVFTPKTEADKNRISDYYNERKKLQAKIITLPDQNTQKYSLFILSRSGCNDDSHLVFPDNASIELYSILNFIREICGK
jgi:hypothetical protein